MKKMLCTGAALVGTTLVFVGLVGLAASLSKPEDVQTWYSVPAAPPKPLASLVYGEDAAIASAVANPAPIVPSTFKVATMDFSGEGTPDVYIASYKRDFSSQLEKYSSDTNRFGLQIFRVLDGKLRLLYEEGAVFEYGFSGWVPDGQSDLDRDGLPELFLTGSWDGTGGYESWKVLDYSGKPAGGIKEIPVVQSLTEEQVRETFLKPGEEFGAYQLNPDGNGYLPICEERNSFCTSRQSAANALGNVINDFVLQHGQFVGVNYRRVDY